MCVDVYVYIYIYVYIHIYVYIYTYNIYVYIYIWLTIVGPFPKRGLFRDPGSPGQRGREEARPGARAVGTSSYPEPWDPPQGSYNQYIRSI